MTDRKDFPEAWQDYWQASGFKERSLIQEKSFQPLKDGKNVLGISPTGSGKTLAYVLPLLLNVAQNQGTQLLILAPSQELAMQISQVIEKWAVPLELSVQTVIGGANLKRQVEKLKKKPEILVGTPGRVIELIKSKKIKSHLLRTIVMDEVDQLFHEKELNRTKQIISSAPKEFQLVFYSATADRIIEEAQNLAQPLTIIDVTAEDHSAGFVQHAFMQVAPRKKNDYLRGLAHTPQFSALVFFNQVAELGTTEEKLAYEGIPVVGLASDQNKTLRKLAIDQFDKQRVQLLLTTDVGARGLDFKAIPYVVNVDVPLSEESYIHRAGRVGRMGADGTIITFINDATKRDYQRLMKKLDLPTKEVFLYDGNLQQTRKEKSTAKTAREQSKTTTPKRTNKLPSSQPAKVKRKDKNKKNKGARRKKAENNNKKSENKK